MAYSRHALPPPGVLRAFGVQDEAPVWLDGGQGGAWRAGPSVLKPLEMSMSALEWQEALLAEIDGGADIRLAPPVRARDGRLVVDGWTAWRYEPGHRPVARWLDVVAAGRALHSVLRGRSRPGFLAGRTNPWGQADRVAWGEEPPGSAAELPHIAPLVDALRRVHADSQLVHGDLTGNVHLHTGFAPLVIDLSLYWRPTAFATAVVVADAMLFEGAGTDLIDAAALGEGPEFPQCLLRALIFRATTDHVLRPTDVTTQVQTYAPTVHAVLEHLAVTPGSRPRPSLTSGPIRRRHLMPWFRSAGDVNVEVLRVLVDAQVGEDQLRPPRRPRRLGGVQEERRARLARLHS